MELEELIQKLVATTENKCNVKFETNSKATNCTTHMYEGTKRENWKEVLKQAIELHEEAIKAAKRFPIVTSV